MQFHFKIAFVLACLFSLAAQAQTGQGSSSSGGAANPMPGSTLINTAPESPDLNGPASGSQGNLSPNTNSPAAPGTINAPGANPPTVSPPQVTGQGTATGLSNDTTGASTMGSDQSLSSAQRELSSRGFSVTVDGRMGPQTRSAIRSFQASEGLPQTGVLDAATADALGLGAGRAGSASRIAP
jgi:hypothetical protein